MELTTAQIQQVEIYLNKKNFNFIDLKLELLDHIISDIECFMSENYSFENSFVMVKIRWEKHFRETSSFFFGLQYSESKIVIKKAVKMFKPFYFLYLAAYILPVVFFKLVTINFSKNTSDFLNGLLFFLSSIALIYMIFIIVKTLKTKVKTTYRFILKTQYLGIVFLVFGMLLKVFNEKGEAIPFFASFAFGGFAVTFICHHFYKKHKEEIKKHKIS